MERLQGGVGPQNSDRSEVNKKIAQGMGVCLGRVEAVVAVQEMIEHSKNGQGSVAHLAAIKKVAALIADNPEARAAIEEMQ